MAVYGAEKKQESSIYFEIDDEVETLLKFDVVFIGDSTSKKLIDNIKQDGVVLYERK